MSEPRVRRAEIAIEQAHVDRVYTRLDELRAQAEAMRTKGYEIGQGAQREAIFEQASMLFERDMMVYHANQTLQTLDAEYEGLVFGRLDLNTGAKHYVGRMGIRDENSQSLVVDWRAPAAAAFYRATPADPLGVVRRRMIQSARERVTNIEDDLLDPEAAPEGKDPHTYFARSARKIIQLISVSHSAGPGCRYAPCLPCWKSHCPSTMPSSTPTS